MVKEKLDVRYIDCFQNQSVMVQKWPMYSFMIYHRVCNQINTTGATSGAGTNGHNDVAVEKKQDQYYMMRKTCSVDHAYQLEDEAMLFQHFHHFNPRWQFSSEIVWPFFHLKDPVHTKRIQIDRDRFEIDFNVHTKERSIAIGLI